MADDLDDVAGPEDLEELDEDALDALNVDAAEDLEDTDLEDTDLEDTDLEDTDLEIEQDVDQDLSEPVQDGGFAAKNATVAPERTEEADEDEEDETDDEDVEASLDVILKERLVVDDEVDDEELVEPEDRAETSERIRPKQPDEFVCRSCFLVKHPSQLADRRRMLCRDCV